MTKAKWDEFTISVKSVFDELEELDEIDNGPQYRDSLLIMAAYGTVVADAQLALVKAHDEAMRARIQAQYAANSSARLETLKDVLRGDNGVRLATVNAELIRQILQARLSAYMGIQECVAAFMYETQQTKMVRMCELDNVVLMTGYLAQLTDMINRANMHPTLIRETLSSDTPKIFSTDWRKHLTQPKEYKAIHIGPIAPNYGRLKNYSHLQISGVSFKLHFAPGYTGKHKVYVMTKFSPVCCNLTDTKIPTEVVFSLEGQEQALTWPYAYETSTGEVLESKADDNMRAWNGPGPFTVWALNVTVEPPITDESVIVRAEVGFECEGLVRINRLK